ncbi:MAG: DNA cytosine methyltransferase [Acidobacteria bacterium]|nr:DNA cytosine methyltransferase [Acidobacteriota bacterium]MBV9067866.1 DNA cytosine methyltransferase [Acidobacteriota bacterium]MBV9186779.1 DNA cytosine methyltransferase [Acidobacteriota bacterium]
MGKQELLTAIDLFAGAGGFSLAARDLGVRIRIAVELDKHSVSTYRKNFVRRRASPPVVLGADIRDVKWPETLAEAGLRPGECSILMGGPPCQGFSTHRIKGTGVGDPRNQLLAAYFDAMALIQPASFVIENVTGMLWPRHAGYVNEFMSSAEKIGYTVLEPTILNAKDFGVPQNRKRVFIVGWRSDLPLSLEWPPKPTHFPPDSEDVIDFNRRAFVTATSVFATRLPKHDPNAVHINHTEELLRVFRNTPKNGGSRSDSGRILPCHEDHDGHRDVYGRIRLNEPGPTMTTACINPSKGRFLHPLEDHGITARHAARFQGFPDSFTFDGGLFAAARQIGNAVPRQLGRHVLRVLKRAIEERRAKTCRTIHADRL